MIDPNRLQHLVPPLVADGSVRDRLAARKRSRRRPVEELNQRRPDWVEAAHREFVAAGALCHRTNTRNANRAAMAPWHLDQRCEALNNSAAAALRGAAGREGVMMGTIGGIDPAVPRPRREAAYGEQVVYLADTGADFFMLEHVDAVDEALLVIRVARRATDTPVLAQLRFGPDGRTAEGYAAAEAARRLVEGGADALGVSCAPGPGAAVAVVEALLGAGVPVSALLGIAPARGASPYPGAPQLSPEAFAAAMMDFARRGAAIVGGCCGVTPAHIAALAAARRDLPGPAPS